MSVNKLQDQIEHLHSVRSQLDLIAWELDKIKENDYKGCVTSLADLLTHFYFLKVAYDEVDKQAKRIYHHVDFLSKSYIPAKMEEQGVSKVQVDECGKSFYPITKTSCKVLDKDPAFKWLVANGGDALITETVNASSLAGFMNEFVLEKGIDPPEDIFEMKTYQITGVSSFNPKNKKGA